MNTVGKPDTLGGSIRCVVSVSMLTEGWDARTVTHLLGVRAFGTQLLCEQVIGRALRRQSYDPNDDGRFDVEYADVLGIPFDFTAEPDPSSRVQGRDVSGAAHVPGAGGHGLRADHGRDRLESAGRAPDPAWCVDVIVAPLRPDGGLYWWLVANGGGAG